MASRLDPRRRARLRRRVLDWYAGAARPLAFRATSDPWAILVSEVMAQQTQAARAAEAWSGFIGRFPTPASLAEAPLAEVLRAWRGLGYNRRAVSLQRTAAAIVRDHGGTVPSDLVALQRLPGIGPYTARAVAGLAFGRRVGAVDTNVLRVLGRAFFDDATPAAASLQVLADELVPPRSPGTWTHALMDVGATLCRPRAPRCRECPIRPDCAWASRHRDSGLTPAPREEAPAGRGIRGSSSAASRARPQRVAFTATSRWLRGRILDRLRDLDDGAWLPFGEGIGGHDPAAVAVALAALARDGLLELRSTNPPAARLPHA